MAEYTHSAGVPSLNAALMHTLQRHRDILQDYTHEFHKTKANFMAIRERENLMGLIRKDTVSYKRGSGVNSRTELFLKEHDHLRNSDRLTGGTISIAMATKKNMTSQRGMLKSVYSKMNTLANRFPAVNSLIQRLNLRKRRDSLPPGVSLASVPSCCCCMRSTERTAPGLSAHHLHGLLRSREPTKEKDRPSHEPASR